MVKRTVKEGRVDGDGMVRWIEKAVEVTNEVLVGVRDDGWVNALTGLSHASRDKRMLSQFTGAARLSMRREYLEELFHGDDIASLIVELPATEMTREWFELTVQTDEKDSDPETAASIMQTLDALHAQQRITDAIVWGRLYGGSLVLMGIQDGQDVAEKVDLDKIQSVDWLTTLDRFDVQINELYNDPAHEKFGEPMTYRISSSTVGAEVFGTVVHESRVLRFDGVRTGKRRRQDNNGWSESVLTRVIGQVRDFQSSFDGVAHLLTDFSQAVYKIKGLANLLATDKDNLVKKRLQMLDLARSYVRAIPLDADGEEFERKGSGVQGMSDLLDRQMMRLSAASRIPVTLLMGRSPAGQNATGESDVRFFYDHIRAQQESTVRPKIEWLLTVLLNAKDGPTSGVEPDSWGFEWNPLFQTDPLEEARVRLANAQSDNLYIANETLHAEEVADSRFGGDDYGTEISLDREMRDEKAAEEERLAEERAKLPPPPIIAPPQPPQPGDEPSEEDADAVVEDALSGRHAAPEYAAARADGASGFCASCLWADGRLCVRYDFTTDAGFVCGDWVTRDGVRSKKQKRKSKNLVTMRRLKRKR